MPLAPRKVGNATVPPIGFGVMGISTFYGAVDSDEERLKVLDAAYEGGCTHWDSADLYGDSELLIGEWFKRTGKRNEIFLTSKFAITPNGIRGDPEYVKEACAKSLSRLGVDHIDLYYQHRPDPKVPIDVTVGAMAELVKEGKVKYLGLSECTAKDLRRAHTVHPIAALQIEYSPFFLDIESPQVGLMQTARELGITIVAYSPLGRGLLTGRYKSPDDFEADDFRRTVPKFSAENFPKILSIVDKLSEIGKAHSNATSGQVTLAWLLAQGEDILVIPGTKKIKYLKENIRASDVTLTPDEIAAVRKLAKEAETGLVGDRYAEAALASTLVDTPALSD